MKRVTLKQRVGNQEFTVEAESAATARYELDLWLDEVAPLPKPSIVDVLVARLLGKDVDQAPKRVKPGTRRPGGSIVDALTYNEARHAP